MTKAQADISTVHIMPSAATSFACPLVHWSNIATATVLLCTPESSTAMESSLAESRKMKSQPEIIAGTWKAARANANMTEADAREALTRLDPLWDELFPAEQVRIVALLVERVDIGIDGMNVRLRIDGLAGLAREMLVGAVGEAA